MKDELKQARVQGLKLVKVAYGNDDDQKSFQQTQGLLQAVPEPEGHHLARPRSASRRRPGTSPAPSTRARSQLTGLGTPNQMRKYVKDGTVAEVRAVEPGGPRLPRRLRRRRAGLRADHRRARARRSRPASSASAPSARTVRSSSARRPFRHGQHRPVQLLSYQPPAARAAPARRRSRSGRRFMQRVCFLLKVRPDRLDEYRERHAAVWPEMLDALRGHRLAQLLALPARGRAARRLPGDRGLRRGPGGMEATEVNARWQAEMAPFFEDLDGRPDEGVRRPRRGLPSRDEIRDSP